MPKQPEITEGDETGWETASSVSSTSSRFTQPAGPIKEKKQRRKKDRPVVYGPPINPLDQYWEERAKFIKHLEKRFTKFQKRSREDYDRARNPPIRKPPVQNQPPTQASAPPREVQPAANGQKQNIGNPLIMPPNPAGAVMRGGAVAVVSQPTQARPAAQSFQQGGKGSGNPMQGLGRQQKAKNPLQQQLQMEQLKPLSTGLSITPGSFAEVNQKYSSRFQPFASTSRSFSSSPIHLAAAQVTEGRRKKVKNPYTMDLPEAARVLRAFEIASPHSSYTLMIRTRDKTKSKSKNSAALRGRVTLPQDPRKESDIVLVFAEPNSSSRRLAEAVGVTYLGGDELFEPLLSGEINPTKVLSTPGMLPAVTQALARFLGPKGMMPTTRRGTVGEGEELVERIKEAKGSLDWKANERGWVNAVVGRMNFPLSSIEANVRAFINSVKQGSASANPQAAVDDALVSSRKPAKRTPGLVNVKLESTNCHSIELRDMA